MDIRILGAHNTESRNTRLVSLLIDDVLAVEAGALTASLSFPAQQKLQAILLSHQHYDHVRDIPAIGMNYFLRQATLDIYTTKTVDEALVAHMLNDEVYSNFLAKPAEQPAVRCHILEPGQTATIAGYRVRPLPVNHSKPTVGFEITSGDGKTLFYTSDTGPGLAGVWRQISPQLLVIEVTSSNRYESAAATAGHLTPSLLQRELESFREIQGYLPRVILVHMNPVEEATIASEIAGVAGELGAWLQLGYEGMSLTI